MSFFRTLRARFGSFTRRSGQERDLDEELQSYVATLAAGYERRGLSPAAARRAALVEAGGLEQIKEQVREVRVGHAIETTLRDVRYGARVFHRSPGYALVVVLTIALGIGINVAMFSVMHAVLWRQLPYPDPDRIVAIELEAQGVPSAYALPGAAIDLRQQTRLVTNLAIAVGVNANLSIDGVMERVAAASVSDDVLPLLGANPMPHGRVLIDKQDHGPTGWVSGVVISHELWQRRFKSDPLVIGRHVEVNGLDVEVVGVTRPDFRVYLPPSGLVEERVDVWFPNGFDLAGVFRGDSLIGKLAPGATLPQAQAELDTILAAVMASQPATAGATARLTIRRLADVVSRDARPALLALGVAVSLVLLIACVNVANLMLARAKTRERELAVRRALGASRLRLVRQLFAENLVFTVLGAAGGLLLASGGISLVEWLRPTHLPRQADIAINGTVLAWTAGMAIVSSALFGLFPALFFTSHSMGHPLNAGRSGMMRQSRRLQRGLVVAEVALSIVPLVAAGLMLRTFVNLAQAPIGFTPDHVLTARFPISARKVPVGKARWELHRQALDVVRQMPGVEAVSAGGPLPFTPFQVTRKYWRDGSADATPSIGMQQTILPGYLGIMGIPLRAGRDITDDDIALERPVVIVDERLAAQLWNGHALGQRLAMTRGSKVEVLQVVGVTAPIRTSRVRDESSPTIFVPYHVYQIEQTLVVKTQAPIATLGPAIKQAIESLGTGRPVYEIRMLDTIVAESFDDTRFTMLVLVGFAAAALLLAAIGLYGTLAYLISQRTQEFGVRLALGASSGSVLRLVAGEGGLLTALGAGIGLVGALILARALQGLLYGVSAVDALTLAAVIALVGVVAVAAVSLPAWRASRTSPTVALRET
jgi:putative ABC transport system permease protein